MTNDLQRRVWEHRHGEFARFTKRYKVNRLVYHESYSYIWDAIAREKEIKGWTRAKKNALVATLNPMWNDLALALFDTEQTGRGPSLHSG